MMLDTTDQRTARALVIAADAGQWIKVRSKDGHPLAFGVPSQTVAGRYYMVTTNSCQCQDFRRRAGRACKHINAVAVYVALVRASTSLAQHRMSNGRA